MAKKRSTQKRRMPDAVESTSGDSPKKKPAASDGESAQSIGEFFASKGVRETIESIAIAFILAFLFRTFEAEAFVIPTGSMAETLRGRHKDLPCEQCGFQHLAGASEKNIDKFGDVVASTCPVCRHVNRFPPNSPDEPYFTGDRIIVSKFVYDVSEPERWDVIVFKYPFNAKDNYIKRLVGRPNETLKISGGDIWVKPLDSEDEFTIARKPPAKITAMMQTVHDSDYTPKALDDAGWPVRWQADETPAGGSWDVEEKTIEENGVSTVRRAYTVAESSADSPAWLRYHHYTPTQSDWAVAESGGKVSAPAERLITDFYGYNAFINELVHSTDDAPSERREWMEADYEIDDTYGESHGMHWVGDLTMECEVDIAEKEGALLLDLVEAGRHYRCSINLTDGLATLSIVNIDGSTGNFSNDAGENAVATVTGKTSIGKGTHQLRMANVDNQITLWVDDAVVAFDGPTTYLATAQQTPDWNDTDEGDLAPVGIGSEGAKFTVKRMKLFRDIYYVAVKSPNQTTEPLMDYNLASLVMRGNVWTRPRDVLDHPREVREDYPSAFASLFNARREVQFDLGKDKFFTMGDNSPQSMDARIWDDREHFVDRQYLIGKAMFIYWPHATGPVWIPNPWDGFRMTFPLVPNISRMGFVR